MTACPNCTFKTESGITSIEVGRGSVRETLLPLAEKMNKLKH